MRNKLLDQHTELGWLFACAEKVMVEESTNYRENKRSWSNTTNNDAEVKQWERFVSIAESGVKVKKQCLAPLTKASAFWGNDKVWHYGWASMGWGYCKVLGTAVARSPDWNEALVKLNQLLLSRIAKGHPLRASGNPIELIDLEQLKVWPDKSDFEKGRYECRLKYQQVTESDLPDGYGFDQYGLVVPAEVACRLQPATHLNAQSAIDQSQPSDQAAEDARASATITISPLSVVVDGSVSSPTSASPETRIPSNSASSSPLSSPGSTPTTSPDPGISSSSRALRETASMAHLPSSADTATMSGSNAVNGPLWTSNRRSRPTQSYALPASRTRGTKRSTRDHSARCKKAAELPGPELAASCSCSDKIASNFLETIERKQQTNFAENVEIAATYGAEQESLCLEHLRKYASWATTSMLCYQKSEDTMSLQTPKRPTPDFWGSLPSTAMKRRRSNCFDEWGIPIGPSPYRSLH